MPTIYRRDELAIKMYYGNNLDVSPNISVIYNNTYGRFLIISGEMLEGDIPANVQKQIKKLINQYQKDLLKMWKTQEFQVLKTIER